MKIENQEKVQVRGLLASRIERKPSTDIPAYGFFCLEGEMQTDIPVVFRIRDQGGQWIKPTIPKGSLVKCEGYWANGKKSNTRLSFTATSYQLISNHCSYCRNEELSHKALCPFFISEKINCGMKLPNPEDPTIPQILFNHYTEEHKSCQPIKCEILREKIRELASHE